MLLLKSFVKFAPLLEVEQGVVWTALFHNFANRIIFFGFIPL